MTESSDLTLEEILDMAKQVKRWKRLSYTNYNKYVGRFKSGPLKGTKIYSRGDKHLSDSRYEGYVYYMNEKIGELHGAEAKSLYELADGCLTKSELRRQQRKEEKKRAQEEDRLKALEELRERIAPKPEQLPLYRRLGR